MKQKPIRSPKHLARVRKLDCMIRNDEGKHCNGLPVVAHHLTTVNEGGMGEKVGDNHVVPLCQKMHGELHYKGERTFWKKYGLTPEDADEHAAMLWRETLNY